MHQRSGHLFQNNTASRTLALTAERNRATITVHCLCKVVAAVNLTQVLLLPLPLLLLLLQCVMREFPEARMAYGESDEYSFVLHKDTNLYGASPDCAASHLT